MPAMKNHDRLFKELLTLFFSDFIELFLPDLASYLDKSSLVFLDKEIFTDVTRYPYLPAVERAGNVAFQAASRYYIGTE